MKIDIQNALVDYDPTLEADIQRRLMLAFSKVKSHISSVTFILTNVLSGTLQHTKHCSLTITLKRFSEILIEDSQVDIYSAIDRTIQKATRLIYRKISSQGSKG
jgi:ribosome-associated translation inhibitor RaiA